MNVAHSCEHIWGCRSFLTPDRIKGNPAKALNYDENKPKYYGRFNVGVTTINLPDVALSSGRDFDKFWELLEERCELCHKGLQARIKRLDQCTSDVAPILWQHGAYARLEKGESIAPLIRGGYATASLGYAGLYECVKYMTGYSHSHKPEGYDFAIKVMEKLNEICNKWKNEEDIDYSLYGTPIESTTYKFARCLKKRFGEIEGITDKNYITNSYHINVREEINAFDKLRIESDFQRLSPGGQISYTECANLTNNLPAVMALIKFIYENNLYAELNTKSDYCQVCGYDGEMQIADDMDWVCPNCGNKDHSKLNIARRTCGRDPMIATHQIDRNSGETLTDKADGNPEPSRSTKKCSVCGRTKGRIIKHNHKLYCEKHYHQMKKYGKTLDINPRTVYDHNEIHFVDDYAVIDLYDYQANKIAEAKIDTEDVSKVKYIKWKFARGYVISNKKNGSNLYLHRVVLNTDQMVDHINHDPLDNRKSNLRIVNKSQNAMNRKPKGVSVRKDGSYYAYIKINQKTLNLGVYLDEPEAEYARWYAENRLFKEYRYPRKKPIITERREQEIQEYVDRKVQRL